MKLILNLVLVFCVYFEFTCAQWENGAFIGTVSSHQTLGVWNDKDAASYVEVCHNKLGIELFSPAYTIDIASRNLIYIHPEEGGKVKITLTPFTFNKETNNFDCQSPTISCLGSEWQTNDTLRIFHDPALNQTIMVDSIFYLNRNEIRTWKFSIPSCSLELVDVFQSGPIEVSDETIPLYDYSNHRVYFIYDAKKDYGSQRLRGVDIRSATLLYDLRLPIHQTYEVYPQFDPSSGQIVAIVGNGRLSSNSSLQGYIISPLHLNSEKPPQWIVKDLQVGGGGENVQINWRSKTFVSQRFNDSMDGYDQYAWDVLSGKYQRKIFLPHPLDNGWQYDPLLQIMPVDINTASETELETVPGISSADAANIVETRNHNGIYSTVDAMRVLSNITLQTYFTSRPYICV